MKAMLLGYRRLDFKPDEESMAIVDADKHTKSLSDMLCCTWEDVHLVHTDEDIEPCTISELSDVTLTESGKEEWADILNAKVQRVFIGLYGLQIELSDVSAHRLEEFSHALAGYCSIENYEKWFASEKRENTIRILKIEPQKAPYEKE